MPSRRSKKSRVTILIADREGVFRLGLRKLFSVEDDLRVVAQAENGDQVIAMCKSFVPDVAYIQEEILGTSIKDILKEALRLSPKTKMVVIAPAFSNEGADRFADVGASGAILRSSDPELFVKSARKVATGAMWFPDHDGRGGAKSSSSAAPPPARPVETLTRREKTIISGLTQGWRNREIADCLSITEQTVKNHLRSIYDKVGVSDRLELVLYAIHQHLELPSLPGLEAQAH